MTETEILRAIREWLSWKGLWHYRANQIPVKTEEGTYRRFQGKKGLPDLIAIIPQKCPCGLQAVFCGIEVKTPSGTLSSSQAAVLEEIRALGGIGLVVHSVDELERELTPYLT
jgi:hypothetical protein